MTKRSIAIIGGGPAAMMFACSIDSNKYAVTLYEKNSALGRKFLVAGKGGFNLTHSENLNEFAKRYYPQDFIIPFLTNFSNVDFTKWLADIGIETYTGTSKRIFPVKGIKPIEVLKAIENKIALNNIKIRYNHTWNGWSTNGLLLTDKDKQIVVKADLVVFALGGNSWKVTGSEGNWTSYFNSKSIATNSFYPSNCAYKIAWPENVIKLISGKPLKNCKFTCGDTSKTGEAVLTDFGIEGSGIYALSQSIRKQLLKNKIANLTIDFKPELLLEEIKRRLYNKGNFSVKDVLLKKIKLSELQIQLLKNCTSKEEYNQAETISRLIKCYPLALIDFAPLDEAISTVGGISLQEINYDLELKKLPGHYCIGEMLDWDAPTGGYLLQACFSMGKFLADRLNNCPV
jgi:uncharacterized flavoprotein (TIGR03862 family)